MNEELTITISRQDLQALYNAYIVQFFGGLSVQCVEIQKEEIEQKNRIEDIVRNALNPNENK